MQRALSLVPKGLIVPALVCIGALLALYIGILYVGGGTFLYLQDDAYIHLSLARNLALHDTWGLIPGIFASASSSPLWTLLLAASYALIGDATEYLPLLINTVAVVGVVLLAIHIARTVFGMERGRLWITILVVVLAAPLLPFAFGGMEHPLHILTTLAFVFLLANVISGNATSRHRILLYVLAFLMAGLRYESAFVLAIAIVLLLLRRNFRDALLVAIAGALPVILFGLWFVSQGGHFLPNTLLVKKGLSLSFVETIPGLLSAAYLQIKTPLFMLFTAQMLLVLHYRVRRDGDFWRRDTVPLALIAGAFVLQAIFGRLSWVPMFRYEAYLVLIGLLYMCICLRDIPLSTHITPGRLITWLNVIFLAALLILALPFLKRMISYPYVFLNERDLSSITHPYATFFSEKYASESVGVIDIGMVSFYGVPERVRVIDLWGLGNNDVLEAKRNGTYGPEALQRIAQKENIRAMVLFDSWLAAAIPLSWQKVAVWHLPSNVTIGDDRTSFYATTCEDAEVLEERLREFAPKIPQNVEVSFTDWRAECALESKER